MKIPRFSIKDLLLSATYLSIGIGLFGFFCRAPMQFQNDYEWAGIPLWFGTGAFIGAGLLQPFHRPWLGALLGIAAQIAHFICIGLWVRAQFS